MPGFSTYDQVGIEEDVSNIISNIDPMDSPFYTLIQKGRVHNTLYEWQEDEYDAVVDNAAVEGADAAPANHVPTVLRANRTQIFTKTIEVSNTAPAVATYGRSNELAYQSAKKAAELKRDIEGALVGRVQDAEAGDNTNIPRRFGNVLGQDAGQTAASLILARQSSGDATNGAPLTEDNLLNLHQRLFEEGATSVNTLMVTPKDSRTIASFMNSAGRERDFGAMKKLVNVVDLYVSPYGEMKVVMNRFQKAFIPDDGADSRFGEQQADAGTSPSPDADANPDSLGVAILFDPAMWEMSTLRPATRTELSRDGDRRRFQIVCEKGLKHKNYRCSGLLTDLN